MTYPSNTDPDLSCMDCRRHIKVGEPISERLTGLVDDVPLVEIVCVACALAGVA